MKLSIGILTHNEGHYVKNLIESLIEFKQNYSPLFQSEYEVVIVDDCSDDESTVAALKLAAQSGFKVIQHAFQQDFALQKNILTSHCTGDWILNLDADESVSDDLLFNLPSIIENNPTVDAYWFPRKNVVIGLGLSHAQKWSWPVTIVEGVSSRTVEATKSISDDSRALLTTINAIVAEADGWTIYYEPLVAWPDWQLRLYRNDPKIRWVQPVHERIEGYAVASRFPESMEFAIEHTKAIDRQERQNALYQTMISKTI